MLIILLWAWEWDLGDLTKFLSIESGFYMEAIAAFGNDTQASQHNKPSYVVIERQHWYFMEIPTWVPELQGRDMSAQGSLKPASAGLVTAPYSQQIILALAGMLTPGEISCNQMEHLALGLLCGASCELADSTYSPDEVE